jgi:hypothetical protein
MLGDALLDLSHRGDIVIDPFVGSGSTLIAADRTGRVCRGVEIDPLYVDLIIRRFQMETAPGPRTWIEGVGYLRLGAQGRDLLETRYCGDLAGGVMEAAYS